MITELMKLQIVYKPDEEPAIDYEKLGIEPPAEEEPTYRVGTAYIDPYCIVALFESRNKPEDNHTTISLVNGEDVTVLMPIDEFYELLKQHLKGTR